MSALQPATLVLGGSGFVGRRVVRSALARAARSASDPTDDEELEDVVISASREPALGLDGSETGLVLATFDVAKHGGAAELLDAFAPRRIVLLTALARIADCDAYPGYARALNVELPGDVAQWTAKHGARLVHVSTDLVFGAAAPPVAGFAETDAPAPTSNYGRQKLEGERRVLATDPAALVVRLPLLWDARGAGCGASEPLLDALAKGGRPKLFVDEWRTPLFVDDAARALVELAHGAVRGVLHVAGPERITRHELGTSLAIASGMPPAEVRRRIAAVKRADVGMEATRPADVCLDSTKARTEHGLALPGASQVLARLAREHRARSGA